MTASGRRRLSPRCRNGGRAGAGMTPGWTPWPVLYRWRRRGLNFPVFSAVTAGTAGRRTRRYPISWFKLMNFSSDLAWWVTAVDLPCLGGLIWLIWRTRREQADALQ